MHLLLAAQPSAANENKASLLVLVDLSRLRNGYVYCTLKGRREDKDRSCEEQRLNIQGEIGESQKIQSPGFCRAIHVGISTRQRTLSNHSPSSMFVHNAPFRSFLALIACLFVYDLLYPTTQSLLIPFA